MQEFLAELYVPRTGAQSVRRWADDARRGARALTREGIEVRYVRTIFIPDDETCFYLFEAVSADGVRAVAERAGLRFDRIGEAADVKEVRR